MYKKRFTIIDVAKDANTSIATVSAVVNKTAFVNKELKERVEASISKLGFIPNNLARSLKCQKSYQVGVLISDIRNTFYSEFYRSFEDIVRAKRYNIFLCNSDNNAELELEYMQLLLQKRVDAIAIAVSNKKSLDEALNYYKMGIPIVAIDLSPENIFDNFFSSVKVDGFQGAKIAAQHLIDNGYRKIAVVAHYAQYINYKERVDGYIASLKENKIEINKEYIKIGGFSNIEAEKSTEELLKLPHPPDAIFATNNRMVLGALLAINKLKLRIPDDIAIVGFDEFDWARFLNPPLTTIKQPTFDIGKVAAKEIFRLIEKNSDIKPRNIILPPELIIRESSRRKD